MNPKTKYKLHPWWTTDLCLFNLLLLFLPAGSALNTDGVLLLSFKYAILSDPLAVLDSWNYDDQTPCSWNGVLCTQIGDLLRVTTLALPNSKLLGSIPREIGQLDHLTQIDLSGNFLNGSLPDDIFSSPNLQVLSLSNNVISGAIPEGTGVSALRILNLSDNALAGKVPRILSGLQNLTVVSLRSNYLSGSLPGGFSSVQVLDLSSNLLNGSLPTDFQGMSLKYLNLSYNKISGPISTEFASHIPKTATVDLSFNNLSGAVPQSLTALMLAGNADLCGKPLKSLCSIPSTLSSPPNVSTTSPAAIAVIPKPDNSSPDTAGPNTTGSSSKTAVSTQSGSGLKMGTIVGIVLGDLAGISVLALVIFYVYNLRKKKTTLMGSTKKPAFATKSEVSTQQYPESRKPSGSTWSCLTIKAEETSEATSGSESDQEDKSMAIDQNQTNQKIGLLVTVDGETEMELDRLLKASAYILGATGGSIVYKAVLENGMSYAVRRIGESGLERLKDFESQVRAMGKLKHQNVVRVRGFYWGDDEKLVIYDYIPNGSLASFSYRRSGSSPYHLSLETRMKIAKGVARGLAYIHEKKYVHGNIKPNNILLNSDMEPLISDLGLDRLAIGNQSRKLGVGSIRHLGSQRFTHSMRDEGPHESPSPYTPGSVSSTAVSPYQAPESLKNVKPNAKWDVYSFGIVLLELLTGRIFLEQELTQWTTTLALISSGFEDPTRVLRLVDSGLRSDVSAREEELMACLRLGFSCACLVPQKRPSMKEAQHVLEKIS